MLNELTVTKIVAPPSQANKVAFLMVLQAFL